MTALEDGGPDLFEAPADEEARAVFRLQSDAMAAWAMRRLRDYCRADVEVSTIVQAEVDLLTRRYQADVERLDAWRDAQKATRAGDIAFFEGLLEEYMRGVRAADPRRKRVSTPWGDVTTRETKPRLAVTDRAAFHAWALRERPDLVTVETSTTHDIHAVRKALADTGELPPGTDIDPGGLTVTIRPDLVEEA